MHNPDPLQAKGMKVLLMVLKVPFLTTRRGLSGCHERTRIVLTRQGD